MIALPTMDYFVSTEATSYFVRWATRGPHMRYAIMRPRHQPQGALQLVEVDKHCGIAMEFGSYYANLDDDGVSAELRAVRALRRYRSKLRKVMLDAGIQPTPLSGSLSIHYTSFGHYPGEKCTWLCKERQ